MTSRCLDRVFRGGVISDVDDEASGCWDWLVTGNIESKVRSRRDVLTLWCEYTFFLGSASSQDALTSWINTGKNSIGAYGTSMGPPLFPHHLAHLFPFSCAFCLKLNHFPWYLLWEESFLRSACTEIFLILGTWYSNVLEWFCFASCSCIPFAIRSVMASSLRKWTSRFVGWTLTSTDRGSIWRLNRCQQANQEERMANNLR